MDYDVRSIYDDLPNSAGIQKEVLSIEKPNRSLIKKGDTKVATYADIADLFVASVKRRQQLL